MKTVVFFGMIFSVSAQAQTTVASQRTNEDVEIRIPASQFNAETIFHMKNINGDLNVEGYSGDDILITGNKIVTAKPAVLGNFTPDEIYLKRLKGENSIFVFVQHPGVKAEVRGDELHYRYNHKNKKGRWDDNQLNFEFNLRLKIPHHLMSHISTINGGEVVVEGMSNGIDAGNINGSVILTNISGEIKAQTVNGDIRVEFNTSPQEYSDLHTVNGNIEVIAPENLAAVVTFNSFHGDLYTDFDEIDYLPSRSKKKMDGTNTYSISRSAPIQFGDGGPEMRIRLLNGNAWIKQRKS